MIYLRYWTGQVVSNQVSYETLNDTYDGVEALAAVVVACAIFEEEPATFVAIKVSSALDGDCTVVERVFAITDEALVHAQS